MNNYGSSLYIAKFSDKGSAIRFAKQLQDLTGRDFYIDNTPVVKNVRYRDVSKTRMHITLPKRPRIKESLDEKGNTLKWKRYFSPFHYIFIAVFMYGFFHAFTFYILPRTSLNISTMTLSLVFICLYFAVILTMLIVNSGSFVITITPTEIQYYWQFLGKWIHFSKIKKENILMVKNSLNINNDRVEVISRHAFTLKNETILSYNNKQHKNESSLKEKLHKAKNMTIRINTEPLSISEKFYLEELIINN